MLESRNSYGWGMVGSPTNGFEWCITYTFNPPPTFGLCGPRKMTLKSGDVYKTEAAAIRAGKKFIRESTCDEYKTAKLEAIPAESFHFGY